MHATPAPQFRAGGEGGARGGRVGRPARTSGVLRGRAGPPPAPTFAVSGGCAASGACNAPFLTLPSVR